jgi:hypothetical protein
MPALVKVGQTGRENAVPENSYWVEEYAYALSTNSVVPHGLARAPKQAWTELRCLIAEKNFAVGDRVALVSPQVQISYNTTSINIVTSGTLPSIFDASAAGAAAVITMANWALVVRAEIA